MDLVKNNLSINFGTKLSPVLQEKLTECLNNKETRRELKVGLIKKIDDILQFGSDEFMLSINKDAETGKDLLVLKHIDPNVAGSRLVKRNMIITPSFFNKFKNNIFSVFLSLTERDILMTEKIFNKKDRRDFKIKELLPHVQWLKDHNF